MSPCECALAILLLTAEASDCAALAPLAAVVQPALVQVGLLLELLDPRELDVDPDSQRAYARHGIDLHELRTRYQELRGAPLLHECRRFPPKGFVEEWLATNRAFKAALEARLAVDQVHAEELRRAVAETEELYRVWNLVRDTQHECYYLTARRRALLELRDLVGLEAFYSTQLPPHLPVWHFPAWR